MFHINDMHVVVFVDDGGRAIGIGRNEITMRDGEFDSVVHEDDKWFERFAINCISQVNWFHAVNFSFFREFVESPIQRHQGIQRPLHISLKPFPQAIRYETFLDD